MHATSQDAGITLSRDQLHAWAGRQLTDDEVSRIAAALPNSSLPEVIGILAFAVAPDDLDFDFTTDRSEEPDDA